MAPSKVEPRTVDQTDEWKKFINELSEFHAERGTKFDDTPKVTQIPVDLLKLYNYVIGKGGYDALAVEKNIWLSVAQDLGIGSKTGVAFGLKTVYYKNLVAYEITKFHGETPPPKEILEDVTAAGGGIRQRTLENYPNKRLAESAPATPDASQETGTPSRDTKAEDSGTPSSSRAARGLRAAPAQRIHYQIDSGPSRSANTPRAASSNPNNDPSQASASSKMGDHSQSNGHAQPPALGRVSSHHINSYGSPGYASQSHATRGSGSASASFQPQDFDRQSATVTAFQPPSVQPLPLRPVETPANAPSKFAKRPQAAAPAVPRQAPIPSSLNLQPSPFEGPNIYARCLRSLLSTIPDEEAFALHHLMKISFERGDRYKFEAFAGLSEGLVNIALRVGELFYTVKWTVSYDPDSDGSDPAELDGINGTPDILERIANLTPLPEHLHIHPAAFDEKMTLVTEAAMTFRNMVMLPENSLNMAEFPPLQDLVCIILHLPAFDATVELKHIALDIAEQLTPHLILESHDPLYRTLLAQLHSTDRGTILTSLSALTRTSVKLDESNKLADVPLDILAKVIDWLMLNDEELLHASLDFLYQYTYLVPNLENLLRFRSTFPEKLDSLIKSLARLLSHGAKIVIQKQIIKPEVKIPCTEEVATLPQDLQERLLAVDEPERCYAWLRALFEEDAESSITQIAIWTAYQASFSNRVAQMGKVMITPADFIRNVNHVWASAGAQIIRGQEGGPSKFIIKGIRARSRPVDPDQGGEYFRCLWSMPGPRYHKCNLYFANAERMYHHILEAHMNAKRGPDGYRNLELEAQCFWAGCNKFTEPTKMMLSQLMAHVKLHLLVVQEQFTPAKPSASVVTTDSDGKVSLDLDASNPPSPGATRPKRRNIIPAETIDLVYEETATTRDERNPNILHPAGIPLSAVLVLRNIARNVVKTEAQEELLKMQEEEGVDEKFRGWNDMLFRTVRGRLFEVLTVNRALATDIASLLELLKEK